MVCRVHPDALSQTHAVLEYIHIHLLINIESLGIETVITHDTAATHFPTLQGGSAQGRKQCCLTQMDHPIRVHFT